ncbi:trypsin-like peptidase domain-containing protein [Rhizobium sullae]|uniref:Trypsin-like peptidase n=1 Tax=Rhizobium sullae TaxID=50338 RepID=A0A4R3Q943_RHISU|nr:trypsin-like peptidase domain-containing protein [Rhizobium sullae]TCU17898.1 trypsin-like peptidase [Rhizobium sullae]
MAIEFPLKILKSLWARDPDGTWAINSMKGLTFKSDAESNQRYFLLHGEVELMSKSPNGRFDDVLSLFGTTDFLMQQSIVPVVAWLEGESAIRCIGTASIVSCTGYLITAAHVLLDPLEAGYGAIRVGQEVQHREDLNFGVFIPHWVPGRGMTFQKAYRFFPFVKMWAWGDWKQSPLLFEDDRWEHLTDIAVCQIPEMPNGQAHQPLNMSLNPFVPGEDAYALGYAEMPDIEINPATGRIVDSSFRLNLYVTAGNILQTFPQNHIAKEVSTPGPSFDFDARVPGKMSGAPVFGARGAVIRGVVSRSFSGEEHAYGSMLGPTMELPMNEPEVRGRSLRTLLETGNEGMAQVQGVGL